MGKSTRKLDVSHQSKRKAERMIEKQTNTKKQKKKDIEETIQKKLAEVMENVKKLVEGSSSSEENSSFSESEEEKKDPKTLATVAKNGTSTPLKKVESSDDSESEDQTSSDEDDSAAKKPASATKYGPAAAVKKNGSRDESNSDDETSSGEDAPAAKTVSAVARKKEDETSSADKISLRKNGTSAPVKNVESGDDFTEDETSSDEDEYAAKKPRGSTPEIESSTIEECLIEGDICDTLFVSVMPYSLEDAVKLLFEHFRTVVSYQFARDPNDPSKGCCYVEFPTAEEAGKFVGPSRQWIIGHNVRLFMHMVAKNEPYKPPSRKKKSSFQKEGQEKREIVYRFDKYVEEEEIERLFGKPAKTTSDPPSEPLPTTPKVQSSKTLVVGNLPLSIKQAVENFFKGVGREVVDVEVFTEPSYRERFAWVKFATAEEAKQALLWCGYLLFPDLELCLATEREA